jgi:hypothetical protein
MSDDSENPFMKYKKKPGDVAPDTSSPADFSVAPDENPFMKYKFAPSAPAADEAPPAKEAKPEYQGTTLADVGKSIGSGLKEGVLATATAPGNLEQLARIGIDKTAGLFGYEPGLSSGNYAMPTDAAHPGKHTTYLPSLGDVEEGLKSSGNSLYEPQTTAGKYANTISSFVPMAFGGEASIPSRIARVVGAGAASEGAGEAAEGTDLEGPARFLGAVLGHRLPRAGLRARTPVTNVDPVLERQIGDLNDAGVTPLAGDATGHKFIKNLESGLRETPFGGNPAEQAYHRVMGEYTRAVNAEIGAPYTDAGRAKQGVLAENRRRLGASFDSLAGRNDVPLDAPTMARIDAARQLYEDNVAPAERSPYIAKIHDDLTQQSAQPGANWNPIVNTGGGSLTGPQYQNLRSALLERQGSADTRSAHAIRGIRQALDDSAANNASPADAAEWRLSRTQYRNQLAVEDAMAGASEDASRGYVTPTLLQQSIKKLEGRRSWSLGRGTGLQDLAEAGSPLKPMPNSGSPGRMLALHTLTSLPMGMLTAAATGDPWMMGTAIAGPIAHAAASRALFSPRMQAWLSNRAQAARIGRYDRSTLPLSARAAIAAKGAYGRPDQENDQ